MNMKLDIVDLRTYVSRFKWMQGVTVETKSYPGKYASFAKTKHLLVNMLLSTRWITI